MDKDMKKQERMVNLVIPEAQFINGCMQMTAMGQQNKWLRAEVAELDIEAAEHLQQLQDKSRTISDYSQEIQKGYDEIDELKVQLARRTKLLGEYKDAYKVYKEHAELQEERQKEWLETTAADARALASTSMAQQHEIAKLKEQNSDIKLAIAITVPSTILISVCIGIVTGFALTV